MKRRWLFVVELLVLLDLSRPACAQQGPWSWQNPLPQGQNLHGVHAFDTSSAVAVGDFGTILTTGDGGATWNVQTNVAGSSDALNSVHFVSAQAGWSAGAGGRILKSADGGQNWSPQISGTTQALRAVRFLDAQTGWAVGSGGTILKTGNGGLDWTAQTSETSATLYALHVLDASNVWACGSDGTIVRTSDGGADWNEEYSNSGLNLLGIDSFDSTNGLAVGKFNFSPSKALLVRTGDGGQSWSNPEQLDSFSQPTEVQFIDASNVWIVGTGGLILKSSDGGQNFSPQTSGTTEGLTDVRFSSTSAGWAVGSQGTLLRTADGGAQWDRLHTGVQTRHDLRSISLPTLAAGYTLGVETGFGPIVLKTGDGGESWSQEEGGLGQQILQALFFVDGQTGWAAGSAAFGLGNGILLKTEDGAQSWNEKLRDEGSVLFAVFFLDALSGWAVGDSGTTYRTVDGGTTWVKHKVSGFTGLNAVWFTNEDLGAVAGTQGTIATTEDGGVTWKTRTSGTSVDLRSVHLADQSRGWAVGDSGTILATVDGGQSWDPQTSGTSDALVKVVFVSPLVGWAVGQNGTILKTVDSGQTWNPQPVPPLSFAPGSDGLRDLAIVAPDLWVVGADGRINKANDADARPGLSIADVKVLEGNARGVEAGLTVRLSVLSRGEVRVNYSTAPDSAAEGTDYTAASGTLVLPPGSRTATILVPIQADADAEADESFFVNLSTPTDATISDGQGVCTIRNDDTRISAQAASTGEAEQLVSHVLELSVTLSGPNPATVSVDYATESGSAQENTDFLRTSGTLSFAPSETSKSISITILDDGILEGDESFFVNLSNPSNADLQSGRIEVTMVDNEVVVYEQLQGSGGIRSHFYSQDGSNALDTEAADEFTLQGQAEITGIEVSGNFVNGNTTVPFFSIRIYRDAGGAPGELVGSERSETALVSAGTPATYKMDFSFPLSLDPGTYWLSVRSDLRFVQSLEWLWSASSETRGLPFVYRNPGNGYAEGCTQFGPGNVCPGAAFHDLSFRLITSTSPAPALGVGMPPLGAAIVLVLAAVFRLACRSFHESRLAHRSLFSFSGWSPLALLAAARIARLR